ncbi:MAG TPA: ABC transporter permease [Acidimicrobiia bacterium]|nr:ABC transporter permease [Acidimicrobiia bacterium]
MHRYIGRRLLGLPLVIIMVSVLVFALTRIGGTPIGPYLEPGMTDEEIAALEERFNLDEPLPMQYLAWLGGVVQGDLGWSAVAAAPVVDVFRQRIPASFELGAFAALWAVTLGVGLGTFAARRRNRVGDQVAGVVAVGGASMPTFWLGIVLLIIFWSYLGWFPHGRSDPDIWASIPHPTNFYTIDAIVAGNVNALKDALWHLVLPALTLGYAAVGIVTRMMRSSLLEEMGKDYVDAARARGLPENLVVRRHARRNAFIPTITIIGLSIGIMFEGTVVVETIFGWPGLGSWMASSVLSGDQGTTLAFVIFTSILFVTINMLVDVMYGYLDRRVVVGRS